jgi:hypothetical protein
VKCKNCETESLTETKLKFMCENCSVEEVEELGDLCEYCMEEIDETDMRYFGDE